MTSSDRFAYTIVRAFLLPAVRATDHHERWKAVNRAAGVIVGYALADYQNSPQCDKELTTIVQTALEAVIIEFECATCRPEYRQSPAVRMIAGPHGIQSRVLECLTAIGRTGE